jgi:hypothetical protein
MKVPMWLFVGLLVVGILFSSVQMAASAAPALLKPIVIHSMKNDVSPPLRDIRPTPPAAREPTIREIPLFPRPKAKQQNALPGEGQTSDPVIQDWHSSPNLPPPIQNFNGISNADNQAVTGFFVAPPDTNGDVGPNHYVQWVNITLAIFDKNGNKLLGPIAGNDLWNGFGGLCETQNRGDPIVLYDALADRWFLSQFNFNVNILGLPIPPFFQCIAISQTGDPTGSYHRYAFQMPVNKLNDYPKFGVWPDGYYMSVNQFAPPLLLFSGVGVGAFERAKMLNGQPATLIYFDLQPVNPNFFGLLPADLDGPAPPAGTPNFFVSQDDGAIVGGADRLNIWEFRPNFANPPGSTFGLNGSPNTVLNTASFDSNMCNFSRDCIPQPGTNQRLAAIADRLMHRLAYRTFSTHQTLVVNHTVDAGNDRAGIRWYELRKSGSNNWSIFQQGTYAPNDGNHRWMGSIAMDKDGNIGLGYSVSSDTTFPSIRYVGRVPGDPAGTLPQGETTLIAGGGSQTASSQNGGNRWGDYSMMSIDPTDDCTFWYTQEYYDSTGDLNGLGWKTRIGSFRFPSCRPSTGLANLRGFASSGDVSAACFNAVEKNTFRPGERIRFNLFWDDTVETDFNNEYNVTHGVLLPPGNPVILNMEDFSFDTSGFPPGTPGEFCVFLDIGPIPSTAPSVSNIQWGGRVIKLEDNQQVIGIVDRFDITR